MGRDFGRPSRSGRSIREEATSLHTPFLLQEEAVRTDRDRVDLQQAVKALGRLVIQQETSIRVLRQDTSWVIFVQPGPQSSLQLLFKVGQAWKDKGAVNRPPRCSWRT